MSKVQTIHEQVSNQRKMEELYYIIIKHVASMSRSRNAACNIAFAVHVLYLPLPETLRPQSAFRVAKRKLPSLDLGPRIGILGVVYWVVSARM